MLTGKATVNAAMGLHARPASELVKMVKGFAPSKVTLSNGVKTVNAASMLSLLSLGLKNGTEVEVTVDGGDEASVLSEICSFISVFE